jgi:hypothetical protein
LGGGTFGSTTQEGTGPMEGVGSAA